MGKERERVKGYIKVMNYYIYREIIDEESVKPVECYKREIYSKKKISFISSLAFLSSLSLLPLPLLYPSLSLSSSSSLAC